MAGKMITPCISCGMPRQEPAPNECLHPANHGPVQPAGATEAPEWDVDVAQALEAIGSAVGAAVGPLAQSFQEVRAALKAATRDLVALQESHAALLDLLDRSGVQGNWAQDVTLIADARALQQRLTPGGTSGTTPQD